MSPVTLITSSRRSRPSHDRGRWTHENILSWRQGCVQGPRRRLLPCPEGVDFGFLGPNGAGKTTTIRILATILPPTAGTASVAGYTIHDAPLKVKASIGYMPGYQGCRPVSVHGFVAPERCSVAATGKGSRRIARGGNPGPLWQPLRRNCLGPCPAGSDGRPRRRRLEQPRRGQSLLKPIRSTAIPMATVCRTDSKLRIYACLPSQMENMIPRHAHGRGCGFGRRWDTEPPGIPAEHRSLSAAPSHD